MPRKMRYLGAQNKTITVATTDTIDDTSSIHHSLAGYKVNELNFSIKNFQYPGLQQPSSRHATRTVSASDHPALPDVTLGNENTHGKETTVG